MSNQINGRFLVRLLNTDMAKALAEIIKFRFSALHFYVSNLGIDRLRLKFLGLQLFSFDGVIQ